MASAWWESELSHVWVMGEVRAAYTERRFSGKIDEPSRYRPRCSRSTGTPETAPHLIDSVWRLLCLHIIEEVMLKKKKTVRLWFISWSLLFYRPSESDWKEKKGAFFLSLSISCIEDGSANTNLQGAYPPVIMYRLNCRATVSVCECVELGILRSLWVGVISDFACTRASICLCSRVSM